MIRVDYSLRAAMLALAASMLAIAPARAAPSSCSLAYITAVPLTLAHNRLFVDVRIGGTTVPMFLDTGSNLSMLSLATARTLDLRVQPDVGSRFSSQQMHGVGGDREFSMMTASHVHIGDVSAPNMRFGVPGGTRAADAGHDADLLGMNPLAGFDIDLDLLGRRLVLFQGNDFCKQPRVLMAGPLYVVPMIGDPRDIHTTIEVTLAGKSLLAGLDTGATRSVMTSRAARRVGLTDQMLASDPHNKTTGIGGVPVDEVRHLSAPLSIGDLTVANIRMGVIDESLNGVDMLLGMDFLTKVHTWLSNSTRTVVFQVPPTASPPVPGLPASR